MRSIARLFGVGLFKGFAFVAAIALIVVIWIYNSQLLVFAEDANLGAIRFAANHMPQGYGSKMESALRLFGADKAFLFTEVVALVKLSLLALRYPFRRR